MIYALTLAVTLIMIGTHGYGLFLFGAILPDLQSKYGFGYDFIGTASATLQVAYMCGALLLGMAGNRMPARYWLTSSTVCCCALMLLLRLNHSPDLMLAAFALLGAFSAISWSSAVGVINGCLPLGRRGLILTIGASGGSWGMLSIGVLTDYGRALFAPEDLWLLGSGFALLGLFILAPFLQRSAANTASSAHATDLAGVRGWTLEQKRVAGLAIVLSGLVGATAIPFTTYLSTYLIGEVGRAQKVASSVWQVLGITGAMSGVLIGAIADRMDHRKIIIATFLAFAAASWFLAWAPTSSAIALAGIGHGVALNPFWGLLAAYIGTFFPPTATMRIDALGLVAFGLFSAMANWSIGQWATTGGSLGTVYMLLGGAILTMATLVLTAPRPRAHPVALTSRKTP